MLTLIVAAVLPDMPELEPDHRQEAGIAAVNFVAQALAQAPLHLRSLEAVARIFVFFALLPSAPWTKLNHTPPGYAGFVLRILETTSSVSANLIRLYRSLSIFAFYEHEHVTRALGVTPAKMRQKVFREKYSLLADAET